MISLNFNSTSILFYMLFGGLVLILNGMLLLVILLVRQARVRKEYVLIAGLSLADVVLALGYVSAAASRSFHFGRDAETVPRWRCSLEFFNVLLVIGYPFAGAMSLVLAFDRFLAIYRPVQYGRRTSRYAVAIVSVPFVISICGAAVNFVLTIGDETPVPSFCYTIDSTAPGYFSLVIIVRMTCVLAAALLYIYIYFKLRKRYNAKKLHQTPVSRQHRSTITIGLTRRVEKRHLIQGVIGLTTLNAFVLLFVPDFFLVTDAFHWNRKYGSVFYTCVLLKMLLDFGIHVSRHRLLRRTLVPMSEHWMKGGAGSPTSRLNSPNHHRHHHHHHFFGRLNEESKCLERRHST